MLARLPSTAPFVVLALAALCAPTGAAQDRRAEYFEACVRPLLAERCHRCHGPAEQKSGLRLDHGSFVRRGGERGPAVVPGDPDASRLLRAVSYEDVDLQMPPKARLTDAEVDVLQTWIRDGAFWPDEPVPEAGAPKTGFDLDARRSEHWCWTPPRDVAPPAVDAPRWSASPIDRFVRARLDAAGLTPARPASRATWIRRVTYDLTGLPPAPEEVDAFVRDPADDASARATVVDRLLASPRFGERMARHWMDLVRYAETMGHEYDFPMLAPWRYRDYLIRAFNADVPYDQFVVEHLAGDLLDEPRRDPDTGLPESPLGTTYLWLMDQTHSPVDSRQALSERIDNAIDVTSKTFLGVTVACARCHDHKFDAIATTDYYAWFGVLEGSRYVPRVLEPAGAADAHARVDEAHSALRQALLDDWTSRPADLGALLLAASELPAPPPPASNDVERVKLAAERKLEVWKVAGRLGVDGRRLELLDEALRAGDPALDPRHPLHAFAAVARQDAGDRTSAHWTKSLTTDRADRDGDTTVLDFGRGTLDGQALVDGPAFRLVRDPVTVAVTDGRPSVRALAGAWAHSGATSPREIGTLASHDFRIDARYLHVLVAGTGARFNVVVNGFNLIRDPIYGSLKQTIGHADARWRTVDLEMWRGQRAYVQFCDVPGHDPADPENPGGWSDSAWIAVSRAVLSDDRAPPRASPPAAAEWLGKAPPDDLTGVATRYDDALTAALRALRDGQPAPAPAVALLDWLARHDLLPPPDAGSLAAPVDRLARAEAALPRATVVGTTADGEAIEGHVHIRGSHKNLGERVPRRFLLALDGTPFPGPGSGRLALARRIVDPDNPLTARVMVNRLWHHLLGRGIVPTVDNFGVLGQPPSHPDLLDWLACCFVADGWSVKALVRRIALSETYAMASASDDPRAAEIDPDNVLLHRARVRRLEGEAIRDALLALSGRLDLTMFGPGVPVHLTPFMDGRGRPGRSGPRDGDGRRSVYLEVRRNFLDPMFLAFDTPIPFSTVGARTVSNVPAQALSLMNDPFVHEQTALWARRILDLDGFDDAGRVDRMYREAFARPPEPDELDAALAFLDEQAQRYAGCGPDDARPWSDLAHVLVNVKEFVFLP